MVLLTKCISGMVYLRRVQRIIMDEIYQKLIGRI